MPGLDAVKAGIDEIVVSGSATPFEKKIFIFKPILHLTHPEERQVHMIFTFIIGVLKNQGWVPVIIPKLFFP